MFFAIRYNTIRKNSMTIFGCLQSKAPEITETIFNADMVQNLTHTKIGRVALYALAGFALTGGAALTVLGACTISAACAWSPIINLAFLVGLIASSTLVLSSMLDVSREMRSSFLRAGVDVGTIIVSPALPGIALMLASLSAFRKTSALPHGAPAW